MTALIHYAQKWFVTGNGEVSRPLCDRPKPGTMAEDENLVTCDKCLTALARATERTLAQPCRRCLLPQHVCGHEQPPEQSGRWLAE